ncbi:cytosine permease [Pectobacterium aroidearum]|jgi:cytosine permease|uniref:Cytosine permease n=1 Tax=Pectobacterium aroidearum TaxID=1201031 RepID=A0ABR5Z7Y9_9GAMM|nr:MULTISPECIES: cytosine permease [Pectobacterium]MBA5197904.1 cytosine permease [Pectobacterium aroidearum]MBA5227553.1 cytosine permease [Pectobacterium aroidearum]MBA5230697.1 cytosine permease [Pectobacterium aroidearum]MBA5735882.1 cytosine permease [Pectobacterium aroidearum]UXK02044.1 cytosine permease [Pectobacterium aroidearum]
MSQGNAVPGKEQQGRQIYDYEYEPVPAEARKSWYVIALIWLAMGIDISGLFLGAFLSGGLPFSQAVSATLIGSAFLGVLAALCANVGYGCGLSTTLLSISVFGRFGGKLIGIFSAVSLVGWFAFQLDFFGVMLQKALLHYQIEPGRFLILVFGMALMTSTAIWGVRALGKLSVFSVPLMLILIITGLVLAANNHPEIPLPIIKAPISMGSAISYVVSIWIVSAVMSPDIARYAKTRKDALLGAGLGFFLGNSSTILVALILTHLVGTEDLVEVFFSIGLGMSAIVVLIFAQWTTNSTNLVSASLGLSVVIRALSRPVLVVLMAIAGLLLAYNGMINNFTQFLSLLGVLISPIAGVYLVEYYFIKSSRLQKNVSEASFLNVAAAISWSLGSLVSLLTSPDFFDLFTISSISALDGVIVSMVIYIGIHKIFPQLAD